MHYSLFEKILWDVFCVRNCWDILKLRLVQSRKIKTDTQLTFEQCGGLGTTPPHKRKLDCPRLWFCILWFNRPWIMHVCSYLFLKKSTYKWTCQVQLHIVQGSTVHNMVQWLFKEKKFLTLCGTIPTSTERISTSILNLMM